MACLGILRVANLCSVLGAGRSRSGQSEGDTDQVAARSGKHLLKKNEAEATREGGLKFYCEAEAFWRHNSWLSVESL